MHGSFGVTQAFFIPERQLTQSAQRVHLNCELVIVRVVLLMTPSTATCNADIATDAP